MSLSRNYKSEIVVPGEAVGVIEEYIPAEGVYIDSRTGALRSYYVGRVVKNNTSHTVYIDKPLKKPKMPRVGDLVVGIIVSLRDEIAVLDIFMNIDGTKYSGRYGGILHVSQATEDYVESLHDVYRAGDVVVAKILNSTVPFQLTTAAPNLGVILSFCSLCGNALTRKNSNTLVCPRCGNTEKRKVSLYYGELSKRWVS